MAGAHNLGIFITLKNRGNEEYQLTHPSAYLGGLLRGTHREYNMSRHQAYKLAGTLNVSVADSCYVTCPKTGLKTILEYQEEGWLGRSQNKVHGVIFKYDPKNDNITKIKDVSDKDVLARIEGNWQEKVYYTLGSKPFAKVSVSTFLFDHHQGKNLRVNRRRSPSSTSTRSTPSRRSYHPSNNNSLTSLSSSGTASQML
jgi:hypothetical protein